MSDKKDWKSKDDAYWRENLSEEEYFIRNGGTESPFSGEFCSNKDDGSYHCSNCDSKLFESETKFDSGCGWPSFFARHGDTIEYLEDNSLARQRIEVRCKSCGAHLGHVFDDGPEPTGKRYCINSISLKLHKS